MQHLKLMGPVSVNWTEEEGQPDRGKSAPRFRSQRTVALLGYMAVERRPLAREQLARLFWPDAAPGQGRANLRRELYNLTKVLPDCWQVGPQRVCFSPSPETTVDIYQLPQLEATGRWNDAARLLAGEFLEGVTLRDNLAYESWLLAERERWCAHTEAVLTQACLEQIGHGRYPDALVYGRRLLRLVPWNEAAQQNVMRLLAWTGQREAALRQFELCQQTLAQELAIEPSPETTALYRQIQRGALARPPTPPAFLATQQTRSERRQPAFVARDQELARLHHYLSEAILGQGRVIFVTGGPGRGKTALMRTFAHQALAAHPDLLVAHGNGNAYAGKIEPYAPFREVMAMLTGDVEAGWSAGTITGQHARRLWACMPDVIRLMLIHAPQLFDVLVSGPPLLIRANTAEPAGAVWLAQLEEQVQRRQSETMTVDQVNIYAQCTELLQALAEQAPLLLFLDDMQWVDAASVGLLFHLGRRLATASCRILIVCAYRPTEILHDMWAGRHLLAKLLGEFKRTFGDVWLGLTWRDDAEGQHFVDAIIDSEPNRLTPTFRHDLFDRTAGHPLFTIELLQTMQARGDLIQDVDGCWIATGELDWQALPARVEAVIEERIRQLEPALQEILTIASVEGNVFTAQVVAAVLHLDESVLLGRLAQELARKYRLVQEYAVTTTAGRSLIRYRFEHVLFQEFLYNGLSRGERLLAHRAVAAELEALAGAETDAVAVQLARHYDRADVPEKALSYYVLAADQAAAVYAYDDALAHYNRALDLRPALPVGQETIARLHRKRGVANRTMGRFDQADADMLAALAAAQGAAALPLTWQILIDLGKLWAARNYGRARGFLEQALAVAGQLDDDSARASSLNWLGNWHANHEEPAVALTYHREAMAIFEALDDKRRMAQTLDLLGIAHLLAGDFEESVANYNRSIDLFAALGDLPSLASSLMGRAVTATAPAFLTLVSPTNGGDPFADFREAIDIARRIGSSPDEAWSGWPRALLLAQSGNFGQALQTCRRGLQIAGEIQHREWMVGNRFALGVLHIELLAPEAARQELEQALVLARELDSQYWINHVSGAQARALVGVGDLAEADRCLAAITSLNNSPDTTGKRYCWAAQAVLKMAEGEAAAALAITKTLIQSAAGLRPGGVIPFLWLMQAEAEASLGRLGTAVDLLQTAVASATAANDAFSAWRLHAALSRCLRERGQEREADQAAAAAEGLIGELADSISDDALQRQFYRRAHERVA